MASENMNRWARAYDSDTTSVCLLESCSAFLFQTKGVSGSLDKNGPIYHVWVEDRERYCGPDKRVAHSIYRQAIRDGIIAAQF